MSLKRGDARLDELEQKGLKRALEVAAQRSNDLPVSIWKLSDFQTLSDAIFEASRIQLNAKTLKLLYRKVELGELLNPHHSTKHGLALFLGQPDWQSYLVSEYGEQAQVAAEGSSQEEDESRPRTPLFSRQRLGWGALVVALLIVGAWGLWLYRQQEPVTSIEVSQNEGYSPLTIWIKHSIGGVLPDSFAIDVGHNTKSGRQYLKKSGTDSLLHTYYIPGVYTPCLRYKNRQGEWGFKAYKRVFIYNPDWILLKDFSLENQRIGEQMFDDTLVNDGILGVPSSNVEWRKALARSQGDLSISRTMPYEVSLDSMDFLVRLRNVTPTNLLHNREIVIRLDSEIERYQISLADKGYESWWKWTQFGSKHWTSVKETDYFITHTDQWNEVRIHSLGGKGWVVLNGKKPFPFEYPEKLGKLKSIKFWFRGGGEVDTVSISRSDNGQLIYAKGFGGPAR